MAQNKSDIESGGSTGAEISEINKDGSTTQSFKTPMSTSELMSPTTFPSSPYSVAPFVTNEILQHGEQIKSLGGEQPAIGGLFGTRKYDSIKITDTFKFYLENDDIQRIKLKEIQRRLNMFEGMMKNTTFLGWYTTGNITEECLSVHKKICNVTDSPIILQLDSENKSTILGTAIRIANNKKEYVFVDLPHTLTTNAPTRKLATNSKVAKPDPVASSSKQSPSMGIKVDVTIPSLNVSLNPLITEKIIIQYVSNPEDDSKPVFGGLIGTKTEGNVNILDSFKLDGQDINQDNYKRIGEDYKKEYKGSDFLGWYTSDYGFNNQNIKLHKEVNEITKHPIMLQIRLPQNFKMRSFQKEPKITIYGSTTGIIKDKEELLLFKLSHTFADAERVERADHGAADEKFKKVELFAKRSYALFGAIAINIIAAIVASSHWIFQCIVFFVGILIYVLLMKYYKPHFS